MLFVPQRALPWPSLQTDRKDPGREGDLPKRKEFPAGIHARRGWARQPPEGKKESRPVARSPLLSHPLRPRRLTQRTKAVGPSSRASTGEGGKKAVTWPLSSFPVRAADRGGAGGEGRGGAAAAARRAGLSSVSGVVDGGGSSESTQGKARALGCFGAQIPFTSDAAAAAAAVVSPAGRGPMATLLGWLPPSCRRVA